MDADAHLAVEGHEMDQEMSKLLKVSSRLIYLRLEMATWGNPSKNIVLLKKKGCRAGGPGFNAGGGLGRSRSGPLAARILRTCTRHSVPPESSALGTTLDLGTVSPPEFT